MSARILIVDAMTTNRIVLKVKMQAAQFHVTSYATAAEARSAVDHHRPDIVLVNLAEASGDMLAFCRFLRGKFAGGGLGIIGVGVADTARARFAALDAGADDVMPHPLDDGLLLARIRSLLRIRSVRQELSLRDSTTRALGFEETQSGFDAPPRVSLVLAMGQDVPANLAALPDRQRMMLQRLTPPAACDLMDGPRNPDLLIVDTDAARACGMNGFSLLSELRSRAATRRAAIMVILEPDARAEAAMYLDLGADDVCGANASADELSLRARTLIRRKRVQDGLRERVRDGLHAAITDPLTGLFNRRYIASHLPRLAEEAMNTGRPFAVMILDVDHFKAINDRHGHAAGDQVLIQLAQRLRENLRAIDLVGRMGGEEFLIAMPRTSPRMARLAADRLRRVIGNAPFVAGPMGATISVSVSLGVAISDAADTAPLPPEALCDRADRALYQAKSEGRNKVKMARSAA